MRWLHRWLTAITDPSGHIFSGLSVEAAGARAFLVPTMPLVPTMQMTREDKALLIAGKLPEHAAWKFRRDVAAIEAAQKRIARSQAKVAYGADCGMFPFSEGRSRVSGAGGGGSHCCAR